MEITNYINCNPRVIEKLCQETICLDKRWSVCHKPQWQKKSKETHWVSVFIDRNAVAYFDSFGTEYIPLEVLNKSRR